MKRIHLVLALWLSTGPLALGADPIPPACMGRTIAIGDTVNGQMTTFCTLFVVFVGPPEQRYTYYTEDYYFIGTAGQPISILVRSSAFDSYVELYDAGGQRLAADDNGGGGNDARIPPTSSYFTLPASGTYRIQVRTAKPGSPTGSYTLTLSSGTKPDHNQHGLTGSWYEPATSGQGFEVEVFANPTSGIGSAFVSWFTYDTAGGGAERQRWYTAQGPVVTGQPNIALTIYQNTGGNFNAPPVTNSQVVGTGTLSFDTCSSGQLTYSFNDGTSRSGTIPLTRLTQNVTCSTTASYPANADFALSGNWYVPATSGQGFTIEVNPNSRALFAAWYTYMPSGTAAGATGQRWYTAQAAFTPGLRSMPVTIYETTGGVFDTPTPPGQKTVPVGTGTMTFQSCSAATFSYTFTGASSSGLSGTINLSRVGPLPPGCTGEQEQAACAEIGGVWKVTDAFSYTCTGSFGSGTTAQSVTTNVTITQTGCNISFPSPLGTADTIRTGIVTGNTFQASGPLSVAPAGYLISQNRMDFSGTVADGAQRIDTTGVGTVTGTYQGSPGACSASSTETWIR